LLRFHLYSHVIHHIPAAEDVLPVLDMGQTSYRIRPGLLFQIGSALSRQANFIHSASTGHNPWIEGGPPDLPVFMDESALDESGIPIPGISLFRGYSIQRLEQLRFSSIDDAIHFIRGAKAIHNYYLLFIAQQMRHFFRFGFDSHWNFGAPLSMAKTEVLRRNLPHFPIDSHHDLERLMSHQILRNAVDFACATLLSPSRNNRLITVHRAGQVVLAIWPLSTPIRDAAEAYVVHHMGEINCTVRVLDQFVIDNEPGGGDSDSDSMDDSSEDDDDFI
jgi:hypothetical protein